MTEWSPEVRAALGDLTGAGDAATIAGRRLYLSVYYEGPWVRLAHWLWRFQDGVPSADPDEPPDLPEVPAWRDKLALFCLNRDHSWREHYVNAWSDPPLRWRV